MTEELDVDLNDFDVIVVGGGLTGLVAAYNILKKHSGLSLLLIERNGSLGGRLRHPDSGYYFHSFQNYITNLIEELNLPDHPSHQNHDKCQIYTKNGDKKSKYSSIVACEVYYFIKSLQEASKQPKFEIYTDDTDSQYLATISVDEYINQLVVSSNARAICKSLIFALCGVADVTKISCLWLLVMLNNAGGFFQRFKLSMSSRTKYFIEGGMLRLINNLKDQIFEESGVIYCSEDVKSVKSDDFRAWITTSCKTYKCNYVIIAVPPPQSLDIIFETSRTREQLLMIQQLYHSAPIIYFETLYKTSFWSSNHSTGIISTLESDVGVKLIYNASHSDEKQLNILAGFSSQDEANTEHLFKIINKTFVTIEAKNRLEYHERLVINGTMSVLKPCAFDYHLNPMLKPLRRIYYAASEYARHFLGTVDGAIEAGETVACLILHHARPQVLTTFELMNYIPQSVPPKYPNYLEIDGAFFICLVSNIVTLCVFLKRAWFS